MDTEAGGEANTSQSRHKKGHMMNIYLTASDDEAIVDFVKDHEALYNKNQQECLLVSQQPPAVCQSLKDLDHIQKDSLWKTHPVRVKDQFA